MAFPTNPNVGDIYTSSNGIKFIWDGTKWTSYFQSISSADLTVGGNILIKNTSPALVIQDTDSTGAEQIGFISLRDNTNTEKGWIGYGTSGNNILNIQNSYGSITANSKNIDVYENTTQADNLSTGWYTIAVNPGDRACAKFILRDRSSGNHQSVIFYASHFYGNNSDITVLHHNYYSGSPYRYIRIKEGGTYDGAILQVYIDLESTNLDCYVFENLQSNGWLLKNWIPDGTDPGNVNNFSALTNIAVDADLDKIGIGSYSRRYTSLYTESQGFANQASTKASFFINQSQSDSTYIPNCKNLIEGSSRTRAISFGSLHNSDGTIDAVIHGIDSNGNNNYAWFFQNAGNFVSPGNVTAYSDVRLKKDITPIENALEKIQNLQGVNYKFKNNNNDDKTQLGLIAQDVLKILPEVVLEGSDDDKTLSIAYGNIVALLIEGIKELKKEINVLKVELENQKSIK